MGFELGGGERGSNVLMFWSWSTCWKCDDDHVTEINERIVNNDTTYVFSFLSWIMIHSLKFTLQFQCYLISFPRSRGRSFLKVLRVDHSLGVSIPLLNPSIVSIILPYPSIFWYKSRWHEMLQIHTIFQVLLKGWWHLGGENTPCCKIFLWKKSANLMHITFCQCY